MTRDLGMTSTTNTTSTNTTNLSWWSIRKTKEKSATYNASCIKSDISKGDLEKREEILKDDRNTNTLTVNDVRNIFANTI